MHIIESHCQFSPYVHIILNSFIEDTLFKRKASSSSIKKLELKLNLALTKSHSFFNISKNSIQMNQISYEGSESQAQHCLSRIEDPLWKSVCTEMMDVMGPSSVCKIWNGELGSYCSERKSIDLYCPTEEIAQFIN
jgi:hypothetical protein